MLATLSKFVKKIEISLKWGKTSGAYIKKKVGLIVAATQDLHKSALFEGNGVRLCYVHPSVRLTVGPHVSKRLPSDRFKSNFSLGTYKNLWKIIQIWLNSGKNIGHFTWRPEYVLLLPATLSHHKALFLREIVWNIVRIAEKVEILPERTTALRYQFFCLFCSSS